MGKEEGREGRRPDERRVAFTWQFYLFGMVVASMAFALIVQYLIGPGWGDRFFRGWIDPALNLIVTPLIGAIIGLALVTIANVAYALSNKKGRP